MQFLDCSAMNIFVYEPHIQNFLEHFMVIQNYMENDEEQQLEDEEIPECADAQIVLGRNCIFKVKLSRVMDVFDMLSSSMISFCQGEKIVIKKTHYQHLYEKLSEIKFLPNNQNIIVFKILEIVSFLTIVLENSIIRAYMKSELKSTGAARLFRTKKEALAH